MRRSCRKRKLLHHNFNESWITNELKVKGYPDLYGFPGSSSSDESSSADEARVRSNSKKLVSIYGSASISILHLFQCSAVGYRFPFSMRRFMGCHKVLVRININFRVKYPGSRVFLVPGFFAPGSPASSTCDGVQF